MKIVRPVFTETCDVCGEESDVIYMHKIFTGRTKYICHSCYENGNRQISARQKEWRKTSRGKQVIEHCEKNK